MALGKFNLKSLTGRETLIFLFFLLVSCCLWLMLTLNQDYETDIKVEVNIKDVPENIGFSASGEEVLTVRLRDRGTTLINYTFASFLPITVDYRELINRKGRLALPTSLLRRHIEGQMVSSTAILSMHPDTFVYYTRESALRYPVRLNAKYNVARQYVAGTPKIIPDSVWIYAPASLTDTLQAVNVELKVEDELRDSLSVELPITTISGVKCSPSKVQVVIPVSPFAEKSFEVPIIGVGFPENCRLRTFPSHVKVLMNVNMAMYEHISATDFEVGVDYTSVQGGTSRAKLRILSAPENVRDIRIVPTEVEYLIEQL